MILFFIVIVPPTIISKCTFIKKPLFEFYEIAPKLSVNCHI